MESSWQLKILDNLTNKYTFQPIKVDLIAQMGSRRWQITQRVKYWDLIELLTKLNSRLINWHPGNLCSIGRMLLCFKFNMAIEVNFALLCMGKLWLRCYKLLRLWLWKFPLKIMEPTTFLIPNWLFKLQAEPDLGITSVAHNSATSRHTLPSTECDRQCWPWISTQSGVMIYTEATVGPQ